MGGSVAAIWVGTLVLTVLLFHVPIADTAVRRALRLGTVISVIGIALGALMVPSTPAQRESPVQQLAGAHSVGVADGVGHAGHRLEHDRRRPAHPAFRRHALGGGSGGPGTR